MAVTEISISLKMLSTDGLFQCLYVTHLQQAEFCEIFILMLVSSSMVPSTCRV